VDFTGLECLSDNSKSVIVADSRLTFASLAPL
jgi:hypothetical protein